jgi:hypothetical protein
VFLNVYIEDFAQRLIDVVVIAIQRNIKNVWWSIEQYDFIFSYWNLVFVSDWARYI